MSTLIHLFPLLLFVVLAGCYSDQRQQLAVCKMDLRSKVFSANPEIQAKAETDTLELCMNARGYEVVENSCPIGHSSLGSQSDDYVETGKKIVALGGLQRIDPLCYEPLNWWGKRLFWLEQMVGIAPKA
ncbi:hypothetical protein [Bradyrhizobium sp. URHC0002]